MFQSNLIFIYYFEMKKKKEARRRRRNLCWILLYDLLLLFSFHSLFVCFLSSFRFCAISSAKSFIATNRFIFLDFKLTHVLNNTVRKKIFLFFIRFNFYGIFRSIRINFTLFFVAFSQIDKIRIEPKSKLVLKTNKYSRESRLYWTCFYSVFVFLLLNNFFQLFELFFFYTEPKWDWNG